PVPDGDTGINLQLTMQSVVDAVQEAPADMAATVAAMARGALMGASGNSGVILSQLLRGLAEELSATPEADGTSLQRALSHAADLGYAAVATPVEGTILTVARQAAVAAAGAASTTLAAVIRAVCVGATAALARTPEQLPALKAAGVVDAGGRGLCVVLDALERVVTGQSVQPVAAVLVPRDRSALTVAREAGSDAFAYEVQFLLDGACDDDVAKLSHTLGGLGDSLVVVGGGASSPGLHNVHVHVNDVGAAIEAGVEAGRPFRITVTRFSDQIAASGASLQDFPAAPASGRSVIAVVPGAGLAALYREGGACVITGGPTANPSTAELLDAVRAAGAHEVVLLPNDGNALGVATAAAEAARLEGFDVAVVRTRSSVQGLAALAVCDPTRGFADDVAAMAEAAGSTRWAEVTTAVRESMTMVGVCRPGDVLGLIEGDVVLLGSEVEDVTRQLAERMLNGGGELVTIVTGKGVAEDLTTRLIAHLGHAYPAVEVIAYEGGQPHYPVLLGVE
ncbi:MAG: DAK2 domain-containing protein, partial [Mycobacteriales bacterium]